MKRMYVTLAIILIIPLWGLHALGQKSAPSKNEQLREEMHKRLRESLLFGIGEEDDLFKGMDQMMNEAFSDTFTGLKSNSAIQMDWSESGKGRTLIVTPADPKQKIDLDVNKEMITIKGSSETSRFSNSFSVPHDCDGSKVKISHKNGKIQMDFPFKVTGQ